MGIAIERTRIVVLNYNGRALLEACLPSIVVAAKASPVPCGVTVIDNDSDDESIAYLAEKWPDVAVVREPNRGLASFNAVLARVDDPAVILLNNDVTLEPGAIGPLLASLSEHEDALFSAPQCWTFDGREYEGMRTRVRSRFGLVQGMSRVPGHEAVVALPDLTAAAGPALAVNRSRFLALGGYDPMYFPGRIEDLDLGFRGWLAGWRGYYVPESRAAHLGFGSFAPAYGPDGCDRLAARNTLLFCWANLRGLRLANHLAWLPVRLLHATATGRKAFLSAFIEAASRLGVVWSRRRSQVLAGALWTARQEAFFRRFRW